MSATRVKFGDVVSNLNETVRQGEEHSLTRVVGLEHIEPQDPDLRRWDELSNLPDGTSFTRVFRRGQVLFGKRRAYQRKVAVAPFDGICSSDILVFAPANKKLHPDFLLYVVQSEGFFSHALQTSSGSLSPRTRWQDLATFEFELPTIEEQQKIVELLSGVDAHAEALRNQLNVAQETRKAVLHHLLTAGGDDWTETTLGNVAKVIMGRQLSPSKRAGTRPRPYLRAANIGEWGISLDDVLEMDFTESEEKNFASKPGDVLLVEGGNEKSVGCPALVTSREEGYCIQNTIIRCRVNNIDQLLPLFLFHSLRFSFWTGEFGKLCTGTTIMHLGQKRAVQFPLHLPPLAEQQRIVDEISKIDAVIQETTSALAATRQLRNALLNKEIS